MFNRLLLSTTLLFTYIYCHNEFTEEECLQAHNQLRKLHADTNNVEISSRLSSEALKWVERYVIIDSTIDTRPNNNLPKRKKRHVDNVDPNVHIESWDGDISYPDGSWDRKIDGALIGESIHKMCCDSEPHCPKEFFHNLLFPPSAKDVVYDWYNQEIGNYNFETGQQVSTRFPMKHFASVVWKNSTKIGCAQSAISFKKCVYTIVLYEVEGSVGTPEIFKKNIGNLGVSEKTSNNLMLIIFLIILFVGLICAIILLAYCCRENLQRKYLDVKIKTDTMKAEQELETDSTRWWWLRVCRAKKTQAGRTTLTRPKSLPEKQRPTIEMIPNSAPHRNRTIPHRARGQTNAAEYALRYQGIAQKAENYVPCSQLPLPVPPPKNNKPNPRPPMNRFPSNVSDRSNGDSNGVTNLNFEKPPLIKTSSGGKKPIGRTLSSSGKPPPPPVPSTNGVSKPPVTMPPVLLPPAKPTGPKRPAQVPVPVPAVVSKPKPKPVPRKKPSDDNQLPLVKTKPMLPPVKSISSSTGDESKKSVAEMRRHLENR